MSGYARQETPEARYDRNLNELLQEFRVLQAGTQILFAFLLGIAFTRPFRESDGYVHLVYAITLVVCALATGLFVAPVAVHRTVFRRGLKGSLVRLGNRFALAGTYLLMLAVAGTLLIALDDALGRGTATVVSGSVLAVLVVLWVAVPLALRTRSRGDGDAAVDEGDDRH